MTFGAQVVFKMARDMDLPSISKKPETAWVQDGNEVIDMRLVRQRPKDKSEEQEEEGFHPDFTYPFFGEEEKLYGFQGLRVKLYFTSAALRPYVNVVFDKKRPTMNVNESILKPLWEKMFPTIPVDSIHGCKGTKWTDNEAQFYSWVDQDRAWKPLGEKMHEYQVKGDQEDAEEESRFEIYKCTFGTPEFLSFHRRLQVFLLFFIEGASYIDENDPRWEIYLVFEKKDGRYHTIGYATCYPFYLYPDSIRMRISQFIVFPPYQGAGHGGQLYRFLHRLFLQDKRVADLTVEDPSEGFSDLRTKNDLRLLLEKKAFKLTAEHPLPSADEIQAVRESFKFSKQHMTVLAEMVALKLISASKMADYRIWVKKRIYRKNEEALSTITDPQEVKQKISDAYMNVVSDYRRILNEL